MSRSNKKPGRTARSTIINLKPTVDQKDLQVELSKSGLKILSNVIDGTATKVKETYIKVIDPSGVIFYIYLDKKHKKITEGPIIYVNDVKKVIPMPKSIIEGGFQCVANRVQGVIFENALEIYTIIRTPQNKIKQTYYVLKDEDQKYETSVLPYPVIYYTNFLFNKKHALDNAKIATECLRRTHEKNYMKIVDDIEYKYKKLKGYLKIFKSNTVRFLSKLNSDINTIVEVKNKKPTQVMYNSLLRDKIYRKIVNYDGLIDIDDSVDSLYMLVSKHHDVITSNFKTLGLFYPKDL